MSSPVTVQRDSPLGPGCGANLVSSVLSPGGVFPSMSLLEPPLPLPPACKALPPPSHPALISQSQTLVQDERRGVYHDASVQHLQVGGQVRQMLAEVG